MDNNINDLAESMVSTWTDHGISTLGGMLAGDSGYAASDALHVDQHENLWLKPECELVFELNSESPLYVVKTRDGFWVQPLRPDLKVALSDCDPRSWTTQLRVVGIFG